jgi:tetratricopeptide (TPR) repeat protein
MSNPNKHFWGECPALYTRARMQDVSAAIDRLESLLARGGDGAAAYLYELGALKLGAGDIEGAIEAYARCAASAPASAPVFNNLGTALIKAGRFAQAISALESALALAPGYDRALVNLGKALREAGRPGEAVARLEQALAVRPGYVPALLNLGDTLAATGALAAAEAALEEAIRRSPALPEAHMTLGIVRLQAGRQAESLAALRTAVALAPDHADAHANLAHALFCGGDWRGAWPHFEYRFRRLAQRAKLRTPAGMSRWDGTVSPALELWLVAEQGLGDQLQFARYAMLLHERGARCVLACDSRLVALLSLARLGARVVPFETEPHASSGQWCPLMSLPAWHGTAPDTVPGAGGYLAADPARIERWRARL